MIPFQTLSKFKNQFSKIFLILLVPLLIQFLFNHSAFARGFMFKPGKISAEIPFQKINGLLILPFKLGNENINLILDTGARNIILFDKPGSFGLDPVPGRSITFSGIGKNEAINGKLISEVNIEAENIEGTGLAVVLIKQNKINFPSHEINGLIGYDLFSKFLVSIDYLTQKIHLMKPVDFSPSEIHQQMDLKLIDTKPYLESKFLFNGIEEKIYSCFIDLGAGYDIMLNHNILEKKKKKEVILGVGLTGKVKGQYVLVQNFFMKNYYFNNMTIAIPSSGSYMNDEIISDRDGTIGGKFLERFNNVVFDYSNKKIYFKGKHLLALKENE